MNIISMLLFINYIYLSTFVESININVNKLDIINNRVRNTSLRFIVFNKFYRKLKEDFVNFFIRNKNSNSIIDNNNYYLKLSYYDICNRYYCMTEDDRNNLEFIISLLY